jgi:hypothetical protein
MGGSWVTWYLDDGLVSGTGAQLAWAWDTLLRLLPPIGLTVNPAKCTIWGKRPALPIASAAAALHVIPEEDGTVVLGTPLGAREFQDDYCRTVLDRGKALLEALPEVGDTQVQLGVLRMCLGTCRMQHLLRTLPVGQTRHWAAQLDREMRGTLQTF